MGTTAGLEAGMVAATRLVGVGVRPGAVGVWTGAVGGAAAGGLAGVGVRRILGRLRRGVAVGPGPCEIGVALLWASTAAALAGGVVAAVWVPLWLGTGLLAVAGSVTDALGRRLPDALTAPAAVAAPALALPVGPSAAARALLGGVLLVAVHAAVHLAAPGALGAGDVKLAGAVGAVLGAVSWEALVAGPVLAALGVLVLAVVGRARAVPYGPPVLGATWTVLAVGAITVAPWG